MVRRLTLEEPPSRLAIWSRRMGLFAAAVALLAVVLTRGGFVEAVPGFVVLLGALVLAAIGIVLALAAFVTIWVGGNPGLGRAVLGLFLGAALVAYPAYLAAQNYNVPSLADVSTDTADPPRFEVIARLRAPGANPAEYGPQTAQAQLAVYPDIAPHVLAVTPADAYASALEVVTKRRWRIVDARAPQGGRREGRIEAVALTAVMGFRDDVVIRVRPRGSGSVLDIRSASRYGQRDFGSNARRVLSLIDEIDEEIGVQPATR
jgi:uncharacterized protein (DUF1499 family)